MLSDSVSHLMFGSQIQCSPFKTKSGLYLLLLLPKFLAHLLPTLSGL